MKQIPIFNIRDDYQFQKNEIDEEIKKIITSGSFFLGDHVYRFEQAFKEYISSKYAIGVDSGTSALKIAIRSLGIGLGDEVITTPFTFIAVAEAIIENQATPVFVDIDPLTYNLDPEKIEPLITTNTKAILVVHTYGYPCDMVKIITIAKKYHLEVIEDCSHAHGTLSGDKKVGNIGTIGCYSFFPTKILGAFGDAGGITTNSPFSAQKCISYRNHGRQNDNKYLHNYIGDTACLDNLQAAVLTIKLKRIDEKIASLSEKSAYYSENLATNKSIQVPPISPNTQAFYVYTIRAKQRNKLQKYLLSQDIKTGVYYPIPLHLQPSLHYLGYKTGDFPHAEMAAQEVLSLPLYQTLSSKQQDSISILINQFYKSRSI